jgi:ribosome-associated translation inhibitor RaiA
MALLVTSHLVQLTYEAALKSFWRKETLRKFLRENHVAEAHISSWSSEESKRAFLDRTFASLQRSEVGKKVIGHMATALAEQNTFPDLRDWEDSSVKIAAAQRAVDELKQLIRKHTEKVKNEREIETAKEKARAESAAVRREQTDLAKLMQRLTVELHPQIGTQAGGYAFQEWFYELLAFAEIESRRPYVTGGRQIDGSVTVDGTTYLVELKFTNDQAGSTDIDTFKAKVEGKADNTMGIFLSMSGYSSTAIKEASGRRTALLLLDASHVFLVLTGAMSLADVIRRVRRHAAQTGESYLPAGSFGGG